MSSPSRVETGEPCPGGTSPRPSAGSPGSFHSPLLHRLTTFVPPEPPTPPGQKSAIEFPSPRPSSTIRSGRKPRAIAVPSGPTAPARDRAWSNAWLRSASEMPQVFCDHDAADRRERPSRYRTAGLIPGLRRGSGVLREQRLPLFMDCRPAADASAAALAGWYVERRRPAHTARSAGGRRARSPASRRTRTPSRSPAPGLPTPARSRARPWSPPRRRRRTRTPDRVAADDRGVGAELAPRSDQRLAGYSSLRDTWLRGLIDVREHHRRPAEHVVFQHDAGVDRHVVLDLHVVADDDLAARSRRSGRCCSRGRSSRRS